MSKRKDPVNINGEAAGSTPAASFYRWQLCRCKTLDAPQDVIVSVLDEDRLYTMDEARKIIKEFLSRKV